MTTVPENSPISRLCLYVERSDFYSAGDREVTVRFRANVEHWCLDENGAAAALTLLTPAYESLQDLGIQEEVHPEWIPSLEDEKIDLDRPEGQEVYYIERRSIRLAKVLNYKEVQRLFGERSKVQEAIKRLGGGADLERRES